MEKASSTHDRWKGRRRPKNIQRTEKPSQVVYTMLMNIDRKKPNVRWAGLCASETPLFQDVSGCLLTVDPMQALKRRHSRTLPRIS